MSKFAIASLYLPNYQSLANVVNKNKQDYCLLYGYSYLTKTEGFSNLGFDKIRFIEENLSNYEWIWWQDLDSIITNNKITIESIIDESADIIISRDRCGINAGSFLIRNSVNSFKILDFILSKESQYKNHHWQEQQVIIDNLDDFKNVKIVDQKTINSYYNWHYGDKPDAPGTWSEGDILLHLPGMTLNDRLNYIKKHADTKN